MIHDSFQTVYWPGCSSPGQLCVVNSAQEGVDVPLTMLGVKNNGVSTDWVIFWGKIRWQHKLCKKWSLIASENWWWIGNHDNPGNQVEVGSLPLPIGSGFTHLVQDFWNINGRKVAWYFFSFSWFIFLPTPWQVALEMFARLRFVEQTSRLKCVSCTIVHIFLRHPWNR